ncbi:MAG: hypothetical protein LBH29_07715, partial [Elusimicrobiota bacterium]|nr:hypothetical protein [Elusimicrobiota bacterium]
MKNLLKFAVISLVFVFAVAAASAFPTLKGLLDSTAEKAVNKVSDKTSERIDRTIDKEIEEQLEGKAEAKTDKKSEIGNDKQTGKDALSRISTPNKDRAYSEFVGEMKAVGKDGTVYSMPGAKTKMLLIKDYGLGTVSYSDAICITFEKKNKEGNVVETGFLDKKDFIITFKPNGIAKAVHITENGKFGYLLKREREDIAKG